MSLQTYSVVVATFAAIVAFIALAWQIISKIQENDVKLKVYQRGSDLVTRATWWNEGVVYVILEAVIINASPKATAVVTRYEIALPWKDEFFDLLLEPEGGRGYPFSPESAIVHRREDVLNHRILEQGALPQQQPVMYGMLIGRGRKDLVGEYGLPRELTHTKDSPAEFRQSQMLVWKLPESILTLSYGLLRDGVPADTNPPITVGYGDRKRDPISLPFARD